MSANEYVALKSQVGGHPGVMSSQDGSLIIKPCLPEELAFYQEIASKPELAPLRPLVPKFYGTLKLQGQIKKPEGTSEAVELVPVAPEEQQKDQFAIAAIQHLSIVLENISLSFSKPAILDVKLGTVLAEETASEEKRARMEKTARDTTSWETGVRLTGFQVYDHDSGSMVTTDKKYGKSIKPADLPDGAARFFPVATVTDGDKITGSGLPAPQLRRVLQGLLARLRVIESALAGIELRMIAVSLLVVYESDVSALDGALANYVEPETEGGDEVDDESDDEAEVDPEDGSKKPEPKPFAIKIIDFAHTRLAPGEGPDEGALKGVRTTISLFEGRLAQVADL